MKEEIKIIYEDFVKPVGTNVYFAGLAAFAVPTVTRKLSPLKEKSEIEELENFSSISHTLQGVCWLGGLFINAINPIMLVAGFSNGDIYKLKGYLPLYLGISAFSMATNAASGAYELWRYAGNKARSPSAASSSPSTPAPPTSSKPSPLETKVNTPAIPEAKQAEKTKEIPEKKYDVRKIWDEEFPEIKDLRSEGIKEGR